MEHLSLSLYDLELTDLVFIQKLISRKSLALIKNNGQTLPDIIFSFLPGSPFGWRGHSRSRVTGFHPRVVSSNPLKDLRP